MNRIITCNLSENLIQNLADYIEENFIRQGSKDISRIAFVFGGKRPALFLKKALAQKIKKAFFPPRVFSIDEFIEYIVSRKECFSKITDLDACFIIYKLAQETAADILKGRENFSQFLPWAREILSFIEQLDFEDISLEALKNIQLNAGIGYDVPENINLLLQRIIRLRQAYHLSLKEKKTYSRGLIYLFASKYIQGTEFSEFDRIIFAGFFYLYKTEKEIIKNLYERQKAILFFQGDEEDWGVLKENAKFFSASIKPKEKQIPLYNLSVLAGFDVHSEVCLAREILKKTDKLNKSVIVLSQTDNIIPLLSEISSSVSDFNVSMGYPLNKSSLYSLFESIFNAQGMKKDGQYYAKDYLKVLTHPLVKNLRLLSNPSIIRVLVHKIEEILLGMEKTPLGGSLFFRLSEIEHSRHLYELALAVMKNMGLEVNWDDLKKAVKELHQILFAIWENIRNFYEFSLVLEQMMDLLVKKSSLESYPLNLKMAEKILIIKDELNNASFSREFFAKEDMFKVFKNKLDNELISFSGLPLKGLQILGLFETRCLNFENVIIMDVNESVLPNLKIYEPLIPREVMIILGLNRLENEEEIQRYQFRRLISGAKNVSLIYKESSKYEKSRFIEELIWERQKAAVRLDVLSIQRAGFKVKVLPKRLAVKKDSLIIKFLETREYSASSINTYLRCPLRFYYQYVLGLEEKEDLLEEPEGKDIGMFIHALLDETFSKFIGRKPCIDAGFREEFFAALDKKFSEDFERKMKSDSFLVKEILNFRLERFLDNERQRDVLEIVCLEKTFTRKIKLETGEFRFKAVIDRIDRLFDQSILIVDYKTGGIDNIPETDAEKIEAACKDRETIKNTIKSFQLPLYLYFIDTAPEYKNQRTNACLYALRDIESNFGLTPLFKREEQFANKGKIMQAYLKALNVIIGDILNPDIPFKADESDSRQCANCAFFYLCR